MEGLEGIIENRLTYLPANEAIALAGFILLNMDEQDLGDGAYDYIQQAVACLKKAL